MKPIEEDTPSLSGLILILIIVFLFVFAIEKLKADNNSNHNCDNIITEVTLDTGESFILNQTCTNCTNRGCVEWLGVEE